MLYSNYDGTTHNTYSIGKGSAKIDVQTNSGNMELRDNGGSWIPLAWLGQDVATTASPDWRHITVGLAANSGEVQISNEQLANIADIWTADDVSLRITNSGTGSTGASLQLKPSSENYLFSFEGRGGFRYWSRNTSGPKFVVDDDGYFIAGGASHYGSEYNTIYANTNTSPGLTLIGPDSFGHGFMVTYGDSDYIHFKEDEDDDFMAHVDGTFKIGTYGTIDFGYGTTVNSDWSRRVQIDPYYGMLIDVDNMTSSYSYPATYALEIAGNTANSSTVMLQNNSNAIQEAQLGFRKSRGTWASPTAVLNNDGLLDIFTQAHDGTGFYDVGGIYIKTIEDWSAGAHGAEMQLYLVEDGGTSVETKISIKPSGIQMYKQLALPSGVYINNFSTDGTLGLNSDQVVSTQKAVRTYFDTFAVSYLGDHPHQNVKTTASPYFQALGLAGQASPSEAIHIGDGTGSDLFIKVQAGASNLAGIKFLGGSVDEWHFTYDDLNDNISLGDELYEFMTWKSDGSVQLRYGTDFDEFSIDNTLVGEDDNTIVSEGAIYTFVKNHFDHLVNNSVPIWNTTYLKYIDSGATITTAVPGVALLNLPPAATDPSIGLLNNYDIYVLEENDKVYLRYNYNGTLKGVELTGV